MPRPGAVIVCYAKWCFPPLKESGCRAESLLRCTRMSVKVVKRPPRPPPPTSLQPSVTLDIFAKCQTLSFLASCFCDKNPRHNLARNFSASPSPVARVCQPAFRGWPPKGLKILPDGVPSAFPTFLERDEAAVHQTELGSLQEAGLVLA